MLLNKVFVNMMVKMNEVYVSSLSLNIENYMLEKINDKISFYAIYPNLLLHCHGCYLLNIILK